MKLRKRLKHRFFPGRDDRRRFRSIVSDLIRRRHPFAGAMFRNMLRRYFLGDLFGRRYYMRVTEPLAAPCPLYHLTYSSLLPDMLKNGLMSRDFVFLRNTLDYSDRYFYWKDKRVDLAAAGRHVIIEIDTEKLLRTGHPVYYLERPRELITDTVPPSCIKSVSEYSPHALTARCKTMHEEFMREALDEARKAFDAGEVPVGAVIVKDGNIISRGRNRREETNDPTAHAEIEALRAAAKATGDWRLEGCTLYVTLEPCPMCAGAVAQTHLSRLIYGAADESYGCAGSVYRIPEDPAFPHFCRCDGGVLEDDCRALLRRFFEGRRG